MRGFDFHAPASDLARDLIGATLLVDGVGGRIVETEAYDESEPAAHSYAGVTARTAVMFGPPGRAYVYRSYGLHWCLNIVCAERGHGAAVLIRAIEPTHGLDLMRERRGLAEARLLCAGPGRLCQALAVTHALNAMRLDRRPFSLLPAPAEPKVDILCGVRIGISKAQELPWRFALAGSSYLSKPLRGGGPDAVAHAVSRQVC